MHTKIHEDACKRVVPKRAKDGVGWLSALEGRHLRK
jgi:hypothetical protein